MKSKIDLGKIITIGLIAILTTAILSTSALNTFSEEDDEEENDDQHEEEREKEEKSGKSAKSDSEDDEDEREEHKKGRTETETKEMKIEVEGEIIGNSTQIEVEIEFRTNSTNTDSLLKEIMSKIRLDQNTTSKLLDIQTEEDDEDEELEEKLKVKVEIEDGKAEVKFGYRFVVNATETDDIVAAIVNELQNLELDEGDIELKMEKEGEHGAKELKPKITEKMAEKAREAIEKKGKHEYVENIDKAQKYFGKLDKAVVALKIGLDSDDINSTSFGSAQLILVKIGDNEPMFRAVVNILTDQLVDMLTACLDGNTIGQLTIIHASEELGLSIGHLKETLTGSSITVPGVTVDIVNGTDCKGTPMLSGTV